MKRFIPIAVTLFSFIIFSCSSTQRLGNNQQLRTDLSQKLGIHVTKKDDIKLLSAAADWLGTPYKYGGNNRNGIDCSALTGQIYKKAYGISLERSTTGIAKNNCRRIGKGKLTQGDLVFFNTTHKKKGKGKGVTHVGIFLKKGHFVHASTSRGVIVSSLEEDYYRRHWKMGGRVK